MLILASASPRRKEILENAGFKFDVVVSDFEELPLPNELPQPYSLRNACGKAMDVSERVSSDSVVLGADTIVVTNQNVLLEKPTSKEHAVSMLQMLSDSKHSVFTSYALAQQGKILHCDSQLTEVVFRKLSEVEILRYVNTGEPMDKAGAYGVQGLASCFVKSLVGSHSNVMGLPIAQVIEKFWELGLFVK